MRTIRHEMFELPDNKLLVMHTNLWINGAWPGCDNGDVASFYLVRPSLAEKLDKPEAWW